MSAVLVYAPDVDGHPRVYCRAIADALLDSGWPVVIACGFRDAGHLARSPDLAALRGRAGVTIKDVGLARDCPTGRLTAEQLVGLQREVGAAVTILIEADKFAPEFVRMARREAPRLQGRVLAIFAETSPWYPGEDAATGVPLRRTWKSRVRTAARRMLGERGLGGVPTPREFFEDLLLGKKLVDALLVKDERLAAAKAAPVVWMPEISRPLGGEEQPDGLSSGWEARIEAFKAAQPGRVPVLYFGDDAYYKGYDLWLEFLRRTPQACGIHAGRSDARIEVERYAFDAAATRRDLLSQGRLLEFGGYVATQSLKRASFRAVPVYITTHRLVLSSSTVIQAAEFGVPVLVPDRGLLAHRVRTSGIGLTYRYGDLEHLAGQARRMWAEPMGLREPALKKFYRRFDDAAVVEFWRRIVGPRAA